MTPASGGEIPGWKPGDTTRKHRHQTVSDLFVLNCGYPDSSVFDGEPFLSKPTNPRKGA